MLIPRIFRPSRISKPKARGRRAQSESLFQLELLENRTPLSGGLDVGLASAWISNHAQLSLADISVSPPIALTIQGSVTLSSGPPTGPGGLFNPNELTIQGTIALNPGPLAGSGGGLVNGSFEATLTAATGDSRPPSPGSVDQWVSTVVSGEVAPLFQPAQPNVSFAFSTNLPGIESNAQVQSTLSLLESTLKAGDAWVVDFSGNYFTVSRASQDSVPPIGPTTVHADPLELPLTRLFDPWYPDSEGLGPAPPPMSGSGSANWTIAKVQLSQPDPNNGNLPDVSVLGSLTSTDSRENSSTPMTTESTTGRASGSGFGLISTGLSTQMDLSADSNGSGWMSYVATGGWVVSGSQSSVFRGDVVTALDETATEPSTPASITVGEVPLSILLSGPDAPAQTGSDRLEQVAELIPLEESSLALVATLWTVSSDPRTTPPQWDVEAAGASLEPVAPLASPPSWTIFVTGLNQAFEQSQRDVEQAFFSSTRQPIDEARGARDEGLRWQGPILPASEQGSFDRVRGSSRTGRPTAADEATSPRGRNEARPVRSSMSDAPVHSDEAPTVAAASLPTISAVSAFGLIAGWVWTQRKRWERFRTGRRCRKGP